jgi:hypothetical protein
LATLIKRDLALFGLKITLVAYNNKRYFIRSLGE